MIYLKLSKKYIFGVEFKGIIFKTNLDIDQSLKTQIYIFYSIDNPELLKLN